MTNAFSTDEPVRVARLSDRQLQCLSLVAQHLSSKEIALVLGISRHTADQRIRGALRTLQVETRAEAARLIAQTSGNPGPISFKETIRQIDAPLPFPTARRPTNTLTTGQRLGWITLIAIASTLGVGMYWAGLGSLERLLS